MSTARPALAVWNEKATSVEGGEKTRMSHNFSDWREAVAKVLLPTVTLIYIVCAH